MTHFSAQALDELIRDLRSGVARLRGGATSDQGWRIVVCDGTFLLESWNDELSKVEQITEDDARMWAQRYGPSAVARS